MRQREMREGRRGFSLIELLVVLAIFGLLISLIFVQLGQARARARDAEREQEMKSLQTALALYVVSRGSYPPSTGGFPYGPAPLTGADQVSQDLISAGTLPAIPTDPTNTGNFVYQYSSLDGSTYELTYYLETDSIPGKNGEEGADSNNPQRARP